MLWENTEEEKEGEQSQNLPWETEWVLLLLLLRILLHRWARKTAEMSMRAHSLEARKTFQDLEHLLATVRRREEMAVVANREGCLTAFWSAANRPEEEGNGG